MTNRILPVARKFGVAALLLCALLASCSQDSPERLLSLAKVALEKNDKKTAVIHLKNALQEKPDLAEARFLMAKVLLMDGEVLPAAIELEKAVAAGYSAEEASLLSARILLRKGEIDQLNSRFGAMELKQPIEHSALQVVLAGAALAKGREDDARRRIARALEINPNNVDAQLLNIGFIRKDAGYAAALQEVDKILKTSPKGAEVWLVKAAMLIGKDESAAEAAFRAALENDPSNLSAHSGLLTLLIRRHELTGAAVALKRLQAAYPAQPITLYFSAQYALEKGDLDGAREQVQLMLKAAPEDGQVNALAGFIEERRADYIAAEKYIGRALLADPNSVGLKNELAAVYIALGDPTKALNLLSVLIKSESVAEPSLGAADMARSNAIAGQAYLLLGEPEKAESYLAKAAALAPANLAARTALAVNQLDTGKYDQAISSLQAITAQDEGGVSDMALVAALIRNKDYVKALEAADFLANKPGKKAIALDLRGQIELMRGRPADARPNFEAAFKLEPDNISIAQRLANLDLADGRSDAALQRFESLRKRNPKSIPVVLAVAELQMMSTSSRADARSLLEDALRQAPDSVRLRMALAGALTANRDHAGALSVLQAGLATSPDEVDLLRALAQTQARAGDKNQALKTLRRVVALKPNEPENLVTLADMQALQGDKQGAEQSLVKALELKSDFLIAQVRLTRSLLASGKLDRAKHIITDIERIRPNDGVGYALQAEMAMRENAPERAISAYRKSLDKTPSAETAVRFHRLLTALQRRTEAEGFESDWIRKQPKDVVFMTYAAESALSRGDYKTSLERFSAVLALTPGDASALNNSAWLMQQLKQPGGLELIDKALSLVPHQPAFLDTKASLLAASGRLTDALKSQQEAVALSPGVARYKLHLVSYLLDAGKKADARTEIEALRRTGDAPGLTEELARLSARL